ncbi:hypothetical protein [Alteromonas oceanisediminis]|uniref:hypothetical protein n=1 Tax=Alteromonas oceanisediminis TaxID=2836180 RepID=UPI001BDB3E2B|nr:hypothetical protein [Alteromonas oceanisediminis]MBT0587948.1 hypothetical protein [Alteromonas oceanisediminis]
MTTNIYRSLCFVCALLLSSHSIATDGITSINIPQSDYNGHLNYKDYGTGKHVKIPMRFSIYQSSDGLNLIVDKIFTDPGYEVYSLSVINLDLENNTVIETTFDKNQSQKQSFEILSFAYVGPKKWTLIRRALRQDNNQDAIIVITESVTGTEFRSETRVDYLATTVNENLKRNWVSANLVSE